MNGQKERLMVLDMIAEGKITAEEAEALFKAMEDTGEPSVAYPPEMVAPPPSNGGRSSSKDLIAALKEARVDQVTLSDMQELQGHRLTAEYIREIRSLGLEPDGLEEWFNLRDHDITPRYVRDLREMGITGFDVEGFAVIAAIKT